MVLLAITTKMDIDKNPTSSKQSLFYGILLRQNCKYNFKIVKDSLILPASTTSFEEQSSKKPYLTSVGCTISYE